jgi:hypothetical protein
MNDMDNRRDDTTGIGWYVSDVHCREAIGYLCVELTRKGYLPVDFQSPKLLEMWGRALSKTMDASQPSPIGPDPDLAKDILRKVEFGELQY